LRSAQVYNADGTTWLPDTGSKHHLSEFHCYQDLVNFSPTERILSEKGSFEECNWFHHHHTGYTGNEGNEDESIYSRYMLTFCRREVVDTYKDQLAKLVKGCKDSKRDEWQTDQEEQTKQRNAAEDAIGIAKYKE
jgi:hypothetical protein